MLAKYALLKQMRDHDGMIPHFNFPKIGQTIFRIEHSQVLCAFC
jgi:hypothetical protein